MIENYVFDVGDVLIEVDFEITKKLFQLASEKRFEKFTKEPFFFEFESGAHSKESFFNRIKSTYGLSIDYEEFSKHWNSCLVKEVDGMNKVVSQLSRNGRVLGLSNTNPIHYDYYTVEFDIFRNFETVFASHLMKVRKPDPKI